MCLPYTRLFHTDNINCPRCLQLLALRLLPLLCLLRHQFPSRFCWGRRQVLLLLPVQLCMHAAPWLGWLAILTCAVPAKQKRDMPMRGQVEGQLSTRQYCNTHVMGRVCNQQKTQH